MTLTDDILDRIWDSIREEKKLDLKNIKSREKLQKRLQDFANKENDKRLFNFKNKYAITDGLLKRMGTLVKSYIRNGKEVSGYIKFNKLHKRWSPKEETKAMGLYNAGRTYVEISKIMKLSYSAVKTKLQRLRGIKKS